MCLKYVNCDSICLILLLSNEIMISKSHKIIIENNVLAYQTLELECHSLEYILKKKKKEEEMKQIKPNKLF